MELFLLLSWRKIVWANVKFAPDFSQLVLGPHVHAATQSYVVAGQVLPRKHLQDQRLPRLMMLQRSAASPRRSFPKVRGDFGRSAYSRLSPWWWLTTIHNRGRNYTLFQNVCCAANNAEVPTETVGKQKQRSFAKVGWKGSA